MSNKVVFSDNPQDLQTQIFGSYANQTKAIQTDVNGNLITAGAPLDGSSNPYSVPVTAIYDVRATNLTPMTGWSFNYTINTQFINTSKTINAGITQSNNMAVLNTSTNPNEYAQILTRKSLRCLPGLGSLVRFDAIFSTGVANSEQIIGLGTDQNGLFFGYNGTDFSILRIANSTKYWTKKSDWNVDIMDGTGPSGMNLDTTKGNIYIIEFQWGGFGVVNFYILSTTTGLPVLVNKIEYPNTDTTPILFNDTLPLSAKVSKTTNESDIILSTSTAMAFCEGDPSTQSLRTRNSISATNISATLANQHILSIRNVTSFNSKTNGTNVRLDLITTSNDGNKSTTYNLIRNASFTATPTYTPINATLSVIEYNNTSTTNVTAGTGFQVLSFVCPKNTGTQLFITSLNITLAPGDSLTLAGTTTTNTEINVSFSWEEEW